MWRSDAINIKLEDGYILKGYETIETEDGYNLIFSFEATDDQYGLTASIIIIYAQSVENYIQFTKQKIILYII